MDSRWVSVLIEWVNCLRVGKQIENLQDLQDGEFLINFMSVLMKSHFTPVSIIPEINSLLKAEYPTAVYAFQTDNVHNLKQQEFVPVLSLLMHYSCIVNRQEVLTSPLCYHLSKESQVAIRNFLQEMNLSVNNIDLSAIISKCLSNEIETEANIVDWMASGGDSPLALPLTSHTPLQDYLKTPQIKIGRLLEKDREIKKLRTDLELEKFDKNDLLDELNEHKKKLAGLGSQLKDKCQEISKLRNELCAVEHRITPHKNKRNFNIEHHLRSEISNLEQYVQQLRSEQEDLQSIQDKSMKKLSKAELDLVHANEKIFTLETACEQMTEKDREQKEDLEILRSNCQELNALLTDLRESNHSSSYLDISQGNITTSSKRRSHNLNGSASCEDLACSVIEVQLREAQQENICLKGELNKSIDASKELKNELDLLMTDLAQVNTNYNICRDDNVKLNTKLVQLHESQVELEQVRQELLDSLTEDKTQLTNELICLKDANSQVTTKLQESYLNAKTLKTNLDESIEDGKQTMKLLDLKNKQFETLHNESTKLQEKLDKTTTDFDSTKFALTSLQVAFDDLDSKFERNLRRLDIIVRQRNQHNDYINKNLLFEELLDELEVNNRMEYESKQELCLKIQDFESIVEDMESKIVVLKDNEIFDQEFIRKIQNDLNTSKIHCDDLVKLITGKDAIIDDLNKSLQEMKNTICTLELLNEVVSDKNEEINGLKYSVDTLKCNIVQKQNEISLREWNERSVATFIKGLENVNRSLEERAIDPVEHGLTTNKKSFEFQNDPYLNNIRDAWSINEKEYIKQAALVYKNIGLIITDLDNKNTDIQICKTEYQMKSGELEDLQKLYDCTKDEFQSCKISLEQKIALLNETKSKLEDRLEALKQQNELQVQEIEQLDISLKKLNEEKNEYKAKSEKLKIDIKTAAENLMVAEKRCEEKDDVVAKTNQELLTHKLQLEANKFEATQLKEEVNSYYKEINDVKNTMKQLQFENKESQSKIYTLHNEIRVFENLKEDLIQKNEDLQANNNHVLKELKMKNEEYNGYIEQMKKCKHSKEVEIAQLKVNLDESNAKISELDVQFNLASSRYDKDIKNMQVGISAVQKSCEKLKNKEIKYLKDIKHLKNELSELVTTYQDALKEKNSMQINLGADIAQISCDLTNKKVECSLIEKRNIELLASLDKIQVDLSCLQDEKLNLEIKLSQQKKTFTEECELAIEQHKIELAKLDKSKEKLSQDVDNLSIDLEKKNSNHSRVLMDYDNAQRKLEDTEAEVLNLRDKIDSLQSSNEKFAEQYSNLNLQHSKYIETSEINASLTIKVLESKINEFNVDKDRFTSNINDLNNKIHVLNDELSLSRTNYETQLKIKQTDIDGLIETVDKLNANINMLKTRQNYVQSKICDQEKEIESLTNTQKEMVHYSKLKELEDNCYKLQCAYDILNTGKIDLEQKLVEANLAIEDCESKRTTNTVLYEISLKEKLDIIEKLTDSLSRSQEAVESKNSDISAIQLELESLNKIINMLNHEKETHLTVSSCKIELEEKLEVIEEENFKVIKECERQVNLLKERHDNLNSDISILNINYIALKNELVNSTQAKTKLEDTMSNKEATIESLNVKLSNTEKSLTDSNRRIENLERLLAEKVEQLSDVSEEKMRTNVKLSEFEKALDKAKHDKSCILESHNKTLAVTEANIVSAHEKAIALKLDLEQRIASAERDVLVSKNAKKELEAVLDQEKTARDFVELKLQEETNEKIKLLQLKFRFQTFMTNICEYLEEKDINLDIESQNDLILLESLSNKVELRIIDVIKKKGKLTDFISALENEKNDIEIKIQSLIKDKSALAEEKEELCKKYEDIQADKVQEQNESYEKLLSDHDILKAKYEQFVAYSQESDKLKHELENKIEMLSEKNSSICVHYAKFCQQMRFYKEEIESIIKNRNAIEFTVNMLIDKLSHLQLTASFLNEDTFKSHFEKKQALEIITSDIQKQFIRCSKTIYNVCYTLTNVFEGTVNKIITDTPVEWNAVFDHLSTDESKNKLSEIKQLAEDALQRVTEFVLPVEKPKVLRENVQQQKSVPIIKEDEWKKKFTAMKQKFTLAENAKNIYERKVQQLREETKRLRANTQTGNMDSESHYKTLLHQHLQTKEEHETLIMECDAKYKQLLHEYEQYKKNTKPQTVNVDTTNRNVQDDNKRLERDVQNIREAYGNLMSDSSKLELENMTMRKVLEDRKAQISDLIVIKEAYEKLLEDNNKLMTDIDTLKYKRNRDREEFLRIIKKEKDDFEKREGTRIQDVRNEYELKLEKMKEKMVKLYKEEVDKEMQKMFSEKSENTFLMETIEQLRESLDETQMKLRLVEIERSSAKDLLQSTQRKLTQVETERSTAMQQLKTVRQSSIMGSRDSLHSLSGQLQRSRLTESVRSDSRLNRGTVITDDRRYSTLPRQGGVDVIEEIRIRKRTSINATPNMVSGQDLEMEDEGDMFNNKYLTDLKEGRCNLLPSGRESASSRMSELAFRNSLCLPHLKSSYPCETQFASPACFKEDDIRTGNVDADDTLPTPHRHHPTRALPPVPAQHQPHRRKDAGTTSYKRPGPPTPSKNGGRNSLSGDHHYRAGGALPLRELHAVNDGRASIATSMVASARNRLTPTRLKALFKGRSSSAVAGSSVAGGGGSLISELVCKCSCHIRRIVLRRRCENKRRLTVDTIGLRQLLQQRNGIWRRLAKHILFLISIVSVTVYAVHYFGEKYPWSPSFR